MSTEKDYREFNDFQNAFFCDAQKFQRYTEYELRRHSVPLFLNIAKKFPDLVSSIMNLNGIGWKATESPALLFALREQLSRNKVPDYVYWPTCKEKAIKTASKKSLKTEKGIEFSDKIKNTIINRLRLDNTTYTEKLYSEEIQKLGISLMNDMEIIEKSKTKRTKQK